MLPVIILGASDTKAPEYSMDVGQCAPWAPGVKAAGVRTHFYLQNASLAQKLQSEIMPVLVEMGIIKPNRTRIVEGKDMLDRAEKALTMLRRKEVSGEKLVFGID